MWVRALANNLKLVKVYTKVAENSPKADETDSIGQVDTAFRSFPSELSALAGT